MKQLSRRLILTLLLIGSGSCSSKPPSIQPGPWHAWLDTPGGPLPFHLEFRADGDSLRGLLRNGDRDEPISRIVWNDDAYELHFDYYDAVLRATVSPDGDRLDGSWQKTWGVGEKIGLDFHATAGAAPRFEPEPATDSSPPAAGIDGRWKVIFEYRKGQSSVGIFETQPDGSVHGTFLNVSGDYRYLEGSFEQGRLRLSRFDGSHAFLFDARLTDENTLRGEFWEANYLNTRWIASRDSTAQLVDTFGLFEVTGPVDLAGTNLVGPRGEDCTLDEISVRGKAVVIDIFGTWCPNCHDATRYLSELYDRYRERGLSVVGIGFEFSEDLDRNLRRIEDYRARHDVSYPLTLAWRDEARPPGHVFPTIRGDYVFPTILFLHGDGRVKAVHSGFTSSASREDHLALRGRFERLVEDMLDEGS